MNLRKLIEESQLENEGFAILVRGKNNNPTIKFCTGFSLNNSYAVIKIKAGTYSVCHISTGTRVSSEYTSFKEVKAMYKKVVEDAEKRLSEGKDRIEGIQNLYDKLMKECCKNAGAKTRNGRRSKKKSN